MSTQTTVTMLSVIAHGPFDYRVEERRRPDPGPGEILVKVGAAGICVGDMKSFTGGEIFWGKDGSGDFCESPVTPGHEFAGMVVELGPGSDHHGIAVGDHVTAEQIIPCGQCRFCQRGQYWMCEPLSYGTIDVKCLISAAYPIEEFAPAMDAARTGNLRP